MSQFVFKNVPINTIELTDNIQNVLEKRYYVDLINNEKEKEYSQLCQRVSRVVASAELKSNKETTLENIKDIESAIYSDMISQRFLFNSPCLFNAGIGLTKTELGYNAIYNTNPTLDDYNYINENKNDMQMLFACFVISVPDNLEGIFDSVKKAAVISKAGGGVGANFSFLREKNSPIQNGIVGGSSGPISFIKCWNQMGESVVQGGKRRAALMGMLNSNHPDIEEFINSKTKDGELSYFNISVAIDDLFMEAVEKDLDYCLISPKDKKVISVIKAKALWDEICTKAHTRGDPGIFFIDKANDDNLLKLNPKYEIHSTNPCVTGDTLVDTPNGRKRVDSINVGDKIFTYDGIEEIKDIEINKDTDVYRLYFTDGNFVDTTLSHQFKLKNGGFKQVKYLINNEDEILTYDISNNIKSTVKLLDKKYIGKDIVYDLHAPISDTWITNGYVSRGCGEF